MPSSPLPTVGPGKAGGIMRSCCSFIPPALASPKQRRCGSAISTSFPTTSATYNSEARVARYAGARSGQQPSTRCSPSCATALPTNLSSSTGSAMQSHATVSTGCCATMSAPHPLHLHPCFAGPSVRTPSGTQPPRICCALASISTPSAPGSDTSPSALAVQLSSAVARFPGVSDDPAAGPWPQADRFSRCGLPSRGLLLLDIHPLLCLGPTPLRGCGTGAEEEEDARGAAPCRHLLQCDRAATQRSERSLRVEHPANRDHRDARSSSPEC